MIATWMLYCSLCTAGLAIAATLAERALVRGRGAVRPVWVAAIALSLAVPAGAFFFASRAVAPSQQPVDASNVAMSQSLDIPATVAAPSVASRRSVLTLSSVLANLTRYDRPLTAAWLALAAAVALQFLGGLIALAAMRRRWERRSVLGVPVLVSERTGPAVIGALSPAIVLPEWALALEPDQLTLMLRHEQEHQRAGDARLLTLAHLALVAMPWNPALWWQIVRLRVAIEMDCDARVLRGANARVYGDLLLEVARPRRSPRLVGAIAFAERATQLERRIRVLGRHRAPTSRVARTLAATVGLLAVTAAWVAPHPALPSPAPKLVAHVAHSVAVAATPDVTARSIQIVPPTRLAATSPRRARVTCEPSSPAGNVYHALFNGLTLSGDRQAAACEFLTTLYMQQIAEDSIAAQNAQAVQPRRTVVQTLRNAGLQSLLTNDADRATLAQRLETYSYGRGRSGGPPLAGMRGGRGGGDALLDTLMVTVGGGRGRGGRGGAPDNGARSVAFDTLVFMLNRRLAGNTFERLFDGITLSADQESRARELVANAQTDMEGLRPVVPAMHLRMNANTGVVFMREPSEAALAALLATDAERETLRSRTTTVP